MSRYGKITIVGWIEPEPDILRRYDLVVKPAHGGESVWLNTGPDVTVDYLPGPFAAGDVVRSTARVVWVRTSEDWRVVEGVGDCTRVSDDAVRRWLSNGSAVQLEPKP